MKGGTLFCWGSKKKRKKVKRTINVKGWGRVSKGGSSEEEKRIATSGIYGKGREEGENLVSGVIRGRNEGKKRSDAGSLFDGHWVVEGNFHP